MRAARARASGAVKLEKASARPGERRAGSRREWRGRDERRGRRERRGRDAAPWAATRPRPAAPCARHPDAPRGRSSQLGGALIIGASVVLVVAVLVFVLTRGGDDPDPAAETDGAARDGHRDRDGPAAGANDILLKGPAGSKAVGPDAAVRRPTTGPCASRSPPRASRPTSRARRTRCGSAARTARRSCSGDVKDPVGENGELTSAGPSNADVDEFPQWFADYDTILVTLDAKGAERAGQGHPQRRSSQRRLRKSRSVSFSVRSSAAR